MSVLILGVDEHPAVMGQGHSISMTSSSTICQDAIKVHGVTQRNGMEVARLMRLRHPAMPIIYATGRPDALNAAGPLGPNEALVRKPFRLAELMRAVRQLLHRPGGTPQPS